MEGVEGSGCSSACRPSLSACVPWRSWQTMTPFPPPACSLQAQHPAASIYCCGEQIMHTTSTILLPIHEGPSDSGH